MVGVFVMSDAGARQRFVRTQRGTRRLEALREASRHFIEKQMPRSFAVAFEEHGAKLLILRERGFGHVPCWLRLALRESPTQDDTGADFSRLPAARASAEKSKMLRTNPASC